MSKRSLSVAGIFAGIGGLEYGLHKAGHSAVLLCENSPAADAVLAHRFPDIPRLTDIADLNPPHLQGVDLVTAGFPCQDLSSVGPKGGISGARSSLIVQLLDVLRENPTEWVLLENVKFMLHLSKGAAMTSILHRLESIGYKWAYRVLNTQAFGLPQRRHRVYILASLSHDPCRVLLQPSKTPRPKPSFDLTRPIGFYWTEGQYATGLAADGLPPLKTGSTIGIPSPPAMLLPGGQVCTPNIRDAERLQGFPVNWTIAVEKKAKPSVRWRLIGNAVSTPIPKWIGERIANYDRLSSFQVGLPTELPPGSWPDAAWGCARQQFAADCSDHPVSRSSSLHRFLRYEPKPLSSKAVTGFLRRARRGNLRYPDGFLSSLDDYLERQREA